MRRFSHTIAAEANKSNALLHSSRFVGSTGFTVFVSDLKEQNFFSGARTLQSGHRNLIRAGKMWKKLTPEQQEVYNNRRANLGVNRRALANATGNRRALSDYNVLMKLIYKHPAIYTEGVILLEAEFVSKVVRATLEAMNDEQRAAMRAELEALEGNGDEDAVTDLGTVTVYPKAFYELSALRNVDAGQSYTSVLDKVLPSATDATAEQSSTKVAGSEAVKALLNNAGCRDQFLQLALNTAPFFIPTFDPKMPGESADTVEELAESFAKAALLFVQVMNRQQPTSTRQGVNRTSKAATNGLDPAAVKLYLDEFFVGITEGQRLALNPFYAPAGQAVNPVSAAFEEFCAAYQYVNGADLREDTIPVADLVASFVGLDREEAAANVFGAAGSKSSGVSDVSEDEQAARDEAALQEIVAAAANRAKSQSSATLALPATTLYAPTEILQRDGTQRQTYAGEVLANSPAAWRAIIFNSPALLAVAPADRVQFLQEADRLAPWSKQFGKPIARILQGWHIRGPAKLSKTQYAVSNPNDRTRGRRMSSSTEAALVASIVNAVGSTESIFDRAITLSSPYQTPEQKAFHTHFRIHSSIASLPVIESAWNVREIAAAFFSTEYSGEAVSFVNGNLVSFAREQTRFTDNSANGNVAVRNAAEVFLSKNDTLPCSFVDPRVAKSDAVEEPEITEEEAPAVVAEEKPEKKTAAVSEEEPVNKKTAVVEKEQAPVAKPAVKKTRVVKSARVVKVKKTVAKRGKPAKRGGKKITSKKKAVATGKKKFVKKAVVKKTASSAKKVVKKTKPAAKKPLKKVTVSRKLKKGKKGGKRK